jgi:hypothetical protein
MFRKSGVRKTFRLNVFAVLAIAIALGTISAPRTAHAGFWDWYHDDQSPGQSNNHYPQYPQAPQYPAFPWPDQPDRPGNDGSLADAQKALNEFHSQPRNGLPMYVTKTQWTDADEAQFDKFISKLGAAIAAKKCNTVKTCMQSQDANMYASQDPDGLIMYSDCADFPYFLRLYFAYHNGLPFGYVSEVKMNMRPYASAPSLTDDPSQKALDTSLYGNFITARGGSDVPSAAGNETDLITYLEHMFNIVSTRTYRVGPLTPGYNNADLYPVKVDKVGIRAGTIVHDTGHALVIWNIDPKGVINAIDAHPDGSIQFKNIQPSTLGRSRPDQGLGFYRFRPLHLVNAKQAFNGEIYGGKLVPATDAELYQAGKWSVDQWFGPASNIAPGTTVDPNAWKSAYKSPGFFDYLATQLRDPNVIIPADSVAGDMMISLCDQMQQRVTDVAAFVAANINQQQHPYQLPANVFGEEDPTWGQYSTPGRDGRIRASVGDIIKTAVTQFRLAKAGDPVIKFDGDSAAYVAALRGRIAAMDKSCLVKYVNSKNQTITLTFQQVLARLNKMSFDPYFCPEKAWGASGDELKTCVDTDTDNSWYRAEAPMRNTVGKTSATDKDKLVIRSTQPITLDMLQDPTYIDQPDSSPVNLGTNTPPPMSLDVNFAAPRFLELLTK